MSVGVLPLMQQLFIVYVREKYKIYSSLFSAFEYIAARSDVIRLYLLDM